MVLFKWRDEYNVNIPSIDEQHKKLVAIINDLQVAMIDGKSQDVMKKIIDELVQYTKSHFTHEESLMSTYNYNDLSQHKKIHVDFIEKVTDFQVKFKEGKRLLSVEILNFLRDWLISHINGEDKKYASCLIEKGAR